MAGELEPGQRLLVRGVGVALILGAVWGGWRIMQVEGERPSVELKPATVSVEPAAKVADAVEGAPAEDGEAPRGRRKPPPGGPMPGDEGEEPGARLPEDGLPPGMPGMPGMPGPLGGPIGPVPRQGDLEGGEPGRRLPINVNLATKEVIGTLPGITPVKAEAILKWREEHGPFASCDSLLDVPGFNAHDLEIIRPLCAVQ